MRAGIGGHLDGRVSQLLRKVFQILSGGLVSVEYVMAIATCRKCGRQFTYHCCDGPVCMPCPHCGFDESLEDDAGTPLDERAAD